MPRKLNHTLYKIGFTLVIYLGLFLSANAQNKLNDSKTDTIYYNFYNEVQMIEIIYSFPPSMEAIMEYDRWASTMSSIPPAPNSYYFSVYVFRNLKGEIISVYNQKREKVHPDDFIPVASLKGNLTPHVPNVKKKSILEFHHVGFIRQWDFLEASSSSKPVEFYTIYDNNSIPDKQFPNFFSKLTHEEHTLLRSTRKGMIDTLGNVVLNPIYNNIVVYDSVLLLTKDEKYSFMNKETKKSSIEYEQYKLLSSSLYPFAVKLNEMWGLLSPSGKTVIEPYYEEIIYPSFPGYGRSGDENQKYITISKNKKRGLIDTNLREILPMEYTNIWVNHLMGNDFFIVTKDEKMGVFDSQLKAIVPIRYERIFPSLGRTTFLVEEDEKWGAIDLEGRVIFPAEYLIVGNGNTIYTIHKDNKYGIYDIHMNEIYPIELDGNLESIKNNDNTNSFSYIRKDGKVGIYNHNNKSFIVPQYDKLFFLQSHFAFHKEEKKGILNLNFQEVVPAKYDYTWVIDASKNLYGVELNGKKGVINSTDSVLIPFEYKSIRYISNSTKGMDRYVVEKNGKIGIIDSENKVILEFQFNKFISRSSDYFMMQYNKKMGTYDWNGNEIVAPIYEKWEWIRCTGYYFVMRDNKWGVLNPKSNEILVPVKYRKLANIPCRKVNALIDQEICSARCSKRFWLFGKKDWIFTIN